MTDMKAGNGWGISTLRELVIIKLSFALTAVYVLISVIFAVISDSMTQLLNATYGLANVAVTFIAILAIKKINEPADDRYHFGYAKYEPVMAGLNGILILAVCVMTMGSSIQDIAHPDPVRNGAPVYVYAFVSAVFCILCGWLEKKEANKLRSEVLSSDSQLWLIHGFISAGLLVSLELEGVIKLTAFSRFCDYIDPVMCIVLSLVLLKGPVGILKESFLDIVDACPRGSVYETVRAIMETHIQKHALPGIKGLKVRKAGRKKFITICLSVHGHRTHRETAALRDELLSEITREFPEADISVVFEE